MISILPTSQSDKDELVDRIRRLKEQGLTHSLKKVSGASKNKRKNANVEETVKDTDGSALTNGEVDSVPAKPKSSIKNQDTASLTAKVLAEQKERNKRRKLCGNKNVNSLFSSKNGMDEKHADFMTRGFSIHANAKR